MMTDVEGRPSIISHSSIVIVRYDWGIHGAVKMQSKSHKSLRITDPMADQVSEWLMNTTNGGKGEVVTRSWWCNIYISLAWHIGGERVNFGIRRRVPELVSDGHRYHATYFDPKRVFPFSAKLA